MSSPLRIRHLQVYPLAIPLRVKFKHAAATRSMADPVVVRLTPGSPYAHHAGYGDTLARPYVTGETAETVSEDVLRLFGPLLKEMDAGSFAEALEFAAGLPFEDDGRCVTAARAAVELALIDLAGRVFKRRAADLAGWLELPKFHPPGCLAKIRYSGMVVGNSARTQLWCLRAQRCYGLRGYKIKVGVEGWEAKLERTHGILGGLIRRGVGTLRADANGAWTFDQACEALPVLERFGVCALEQPLPPAEDAALPALAERTRMDLIADESLISPEDARRLIDAGGVRVLNVRVAKNGGLMPALQIARLAISAGLDVQLGCLVGETSILSAASAAFLEICPRVRFVEGAFGRFLMRDDVTRRQVRFGRGGRMRFLRGFGLGVDVDESKLERYLIPVETPNDE